MGFIYRCVLDLEWNMKLLEIVLSRLVDCGGLRAGDRAILAVDFWEG